jgi:prepilin-type N-terminal cleavage/methylation domain-containing protein
MKLKLSAFTLTEVLIVIAIMAIMVVAGIPVYSNLQGETQLIDNEARIVQSLRQMRVQGFVRYNNLNQGVKFLTDRYILYQGPNYASRTPLYDLEYLLDGPLSLTTTLNNNEVNFSRGMGVPNNFGTVTLNHKNYGAKTITINSLGTVNFQ